MKAWIYNELNNLILKDVEPPKPRSGEVILQVKAVNIDKSGLIDTFTTEERKEGMIPGQNFSGLISATGEGVNGKWMGRRVGVYPILPCGECKMCSSGHSEMCLNTQLIGLDRNGALADFVTVPEENLIELPDDVSFEQAALLEPMAEAVHAIRIGINTGANMVPSDSKIAVCGLGTKGYLIALFLIEMGYKKVFVIGTGAKERDRVLSAGIEEQCYFDIENENAVKTYKEITGGVDLFFECTGENGNLSLAMDSANLEGRIVLVGSPKSDMDVGRENYEKLFSNGLEVRGAWGSSFSGGHTSNVDSDDWSYAMRKVLDKKVISESVITHRVKIEELEMDSLLKRADGNCTIMITM